MRFSYAFLLLLFLFIFSPAAKAKDKLQPAANFSFNNNKNYDEVSRRKAKLVGTSFTEDRFNNANSAVYLSGHEHSYVNLGNYPAIKPKAGTISMWVKMSKEIWFGTGYRVNPFILTKCASRNDYYESYSMYYLLDTKKTQAGCLLDSLNAPNVNGMRGFDFMSWHHLAISYDYDFFSFYVDGQLEGKAIKNFETGFDPLDSVMVGVSANKKNNRFLNAAVDDIEFFDRVLSDAEIQELYNAPNPNKNRIILNWFFLIAAVITGIVLIYLLVKYRLSLTLIKEKERLELANKLLENELRINRALMNPHFIFNSLNTLHNYILKNNSDKASDYLVRFSKLVRKILDSNLSDTISLELEIELIHEYLEVESQRFNEHITERVILEDGIVPSAIIIPIMMVQPFIENSVWHGLLDKPGEKLITISFSRSGTQYIKCVIEDNGTGLKKKDSEVFEKKSLATGFVRQRLDLLNKIHKLESYLDIQYKPHSQGTVVTILLPILNK